MISRPCPVISGSPAPPEPRQGERSAPDRAMPIHIEARLLAKGDGRRVAAMLAANAELDAAAGGAAAFGGEFDQFADALHIDADEGIAGEEALVDILRQEPARVVPVDSAGRLREVVGS